MSQHIQIAIDPAVGIDPETLAAEWNGRLSTNTLGNLHTAPAASTSYHDPHTTMLVLDVAIGIATGVLTNLLTDIIKDKFVGKAPTIIKMQQPDGTTTIVIHNP